MATKLICDRCGATTNTRDNTGVVAFSLVNAQNAIASNISKDLCVLCLKDLSEFMKPIVR